VNPFGSRMGTGFMILSHIGQGWVAKWVGNWRAIGGQSVGNRLGFRGGAGLSWCGTQHSKIYERI